MQRKRKCQNIVIPRTNPIQSNLNIWTHLLTSTSVAVSESPLSLPSGRSCSSADIQSGSSTDVRDVDFCDGILRRERTLMPDCERGIWGEVPPSDDPSTSPSDLRALVCASFKRLLEHFTTTIQMVIRNQIWYAHIFSRTKLTYSNPMHPELAV